MGPKKAFPLRLDPELYEALRRWADAELRSVNGQIEFVLREAVRARGLLDGRGKGAGPGKAGVNAGPADAQGKAPDEPNEDGGSARPRREEGEE
jgi:hypothetical protein